MTGTIKICGLSTAETMDTALGAGADMVGLVHFPRSPRHVSVETAARLAQRARGRAAVVLLLVDPTDAAIDEVVREIEPDIVQLHGSESPVRVAAIRARAGRPVMKALGIASAADLARLPAYQEVADRLLLDAQPRSGVDRPGGNGHAFDWSLLSAAEPLGARRDIVLSGGLHPDNVGKAIALTGLRGVDVSSGVEISPGMKDPARIVTFIRAARTAFSSLDAVEPVPADRRVA